MFSFNKENIKKAKGILAKYPDGRQKSAVLPLLDLAQRQNGGWLSVEAIEYVADYISEPYMRVYEVASFYSMFYLKPVGKYHIQVCGTTPCWLKGAEDILQTCEKRIGIKCGNTSADGRFTISEVECLGACVNAPLVQINDDYYEDLTPDKMNDIIDKLSARQNGQKS
ncbi:MAG TPA: NADH-quinone oxidoreductase subunit NuoE [Candidatus Megaira endosymbiont of Stentor roeselii]|nr:NADH-quinone oxidoreductase subunit NuoE [Candidatus Megaera endosymbiont of Stentor roeselii]